MRPTPPPLGTTGGQPPVDDRTRKQELAEWVVIFLGIVCLWPAYILQWPHPVWKLLSYLVLVLLVGVFLRRAGRISAAARAAADDPKPPRL